jgi:hypothetical protein
MAVHRHAAGRVPRRHARPACPVTATRVRPDVWAAALALCDGDPRLLRVVDERHVRIFDARYSPPR